MTVTTLTPSDRHHLADVFWTFVRTDLKARYQGTIGGFVWALLKPLAMFLVLLSVFSFVFQSDGQYKVNLIIGLFLYNFFSEATTVGLGSLFSKGYLLTKVRFPSWIVVVSSVSNPALTLLIFTVVITVFISLTAAVPGPIAMLLFAFALILYVLMVVGIALTTSVLFLRYRDLNQVWEVIIQAGLFLAPIIYPLQIIPEKYRTLLYLWPPTTMVQYSRAVLVEQRIPSAGEHLWFISQTACLLIVGYLVFRKNAPRAAEYL
jgi:lipopolysaccharide transport system permease protein